jgi:hypothetical protein
MMAKTNATISMTVKGITEIMVEQKSDMAAFNTYACQLMHSYCAIKQEEVDTETFLGGEPPVQKDMMSLVSSVDMLEL